MSCIRDLKNKIVYLFTDGFFHILFGNTLIKAISFISTIVIVRIVSKTDYAALVYADNLYSYVILICGFGLSSGLLIYCSREDSSQKKRSIFLLSIKIGMTSMLFGAAIVFLYHTFFGKGFDNANMLMVLLALYPLGNYLMSCCSCFIRAHSENRLFVKVSLVQTVIIFVLSFILVLVIGINGIAAARYCGIIAALIISYKYIHSKIGGIDSEKLEYSYIKSFIVTSFSLWVADICSNIMVSNETFLVNYLINDATTTANYKVAILIPSQLMFVASSITVYFFPKVAKMNAGNEIWKYSKRVGIYTGLLMAAIVIIAMPLTPLLIKIAFGSQYSDIKWLFNMFWIVYGVNTAVRMIPWNIIAAIGKEKFNASVSAILCIVHLVVDYLSIVKYGIYGVAVASLIVYTISGIIAWIYLRYVCKNNEYAVRK